MNNPTGSLISLEDVTEDLVIEYLCTHPEFFQHHEDLLENLYIPHPTGPAISLIERQVERLREQNQLLRQEIIDTLAIAKQNDAIFETTKRLTVSLLEARSFSDVINRLESATLQDFKADYLRIGLVEVPNKLGCGSVVFTYRPGNDVELHELLRGNKAVCRHLSKTQNRTLFGKKSKYVQSTALLPIGLQGQMGVIAIGSKDKHHFHRDKDTLFLDHLGKVVSQIISNYLNT